MIQTLLDGVPAAERLGAYPRTTWPAFFRQLGEVARTIHAVRGRHFGPVAGPGYTTRSEALTASFSDDLTSGLALLGAAFVVRLGAGIEAQPGEHNTVRGGVGLPAKDASVFSRSGLSPMVIRRVAALSGPMPTGMSSCGAWRSTSRVRR
ncbi:hypothetical protein ACWD5V_16505 [Streptomyces sp. NPDC002523]